MIAKRHQAMGIMYNDEVTTIYNPTTVDWTKFLWAGGFYNHVITKIEIYRPYLISEKYFGGNIYYEDIILLLNKIDNPFDLKSGIKLKIPMKKDIDNFIREYKRK